ncbi:MAG: 2-hydroxyacyl-CoA dehydratase [Deltaproteobacteria bacterium]|nr:2-hydroxyacyl-CoA dehydratase [Deltaproteobacteria bacterium]
MTVNQFGAGRAAFEDAYVTLAYFARIWLSTARLGLRLGPVSMGRAAIRYPWVMAFLKVNSFYGKLIGGRSGIQRRAGAHLVHALQNEGTRAFEELVSRPDRLILNEDLVPPEIFFAMGLSSWFAELLGFILPMFDAGKAEHYIDVAESHGLPPDICSLPRHIMGIALSGHLPKPAAVVTSNSPCDGGMASYNIIAKELDCPVFRLDIPYNFETERAADYFAGELSRLVAWLELYTPGRMDWDALREICEERNRMQEAEAALWDMLKVRPAPLAAEPVYLSHLWGFVVQPGRASSTRLIEAMTEFARKNMEAGQGALKDERFRTLLWGPFPAHLPEIWAWAEKTFGVALLLDSLSYNRLPLIDTKSPESMLKSLGRTIMAGPMARHSRGPAQNYFEDMFFAVENFGADMIWHSGHVGCKNARALMGMLREKCRERRIPLLVMDYDLSDPRAGDLAAVKAQISHFMENVMKTAPLA